MNDEQLNRKRSNARSIVAPRVGKIVQVTFRTGEGRKTRTDDFLISRVDETAVWLDEVSWDGVQQKLVPSGNPFAVDLKRIHFIMDGDQGMWPRKG